MLTRVASLLKLKEQPLRSLALLLVRASVGIVFVQTGWGKLHSLSDIIEFFRSLNIPAPEIQAPFVAGLEFVGGALLVVGLCSRLVSVPLMGTMVVAILTAKRSEVESLTDVLSFIEWHYLVSFAVIALCGPGRWSIDHLVSRRVLRGPAALGTAA